MLLGVVVELMVVFLTILFDEVEIIIEFKGLED